MFPLLLVIITIGLVSAQTDNSALPQKITCRSEEVHVISYYEGPCHSGFRIQPSTLVNVEIVDVAMDSSLYLNSYEGIVWNLFGAQVDRISRIEMRSYNAMGIYGAPANASIYYSSQYSSYGAIPSNLASSMGALRVGTVHSGYTMSIYIAIRNNASVPTTKSTSDFTQQCYGIRDPSTGYVTPVIPAGSGYNSTTARYLQTCNVLQSPGPCQTNLVLNNGYVNYSATMTSNTSIVTNATFSCMDGYRLTPSTSTWATCTSSSAAASPDLPTYSKTTPTCVFITCSLSSLQTVIGGTMNVDVTTPAQVNPGVAAQVHCNGGYYFANSTLNATNSVNVTCGSDGNWMWSSQDINATCLVVPTNPPTTAMPTTLAPTTLATTLAPTNTSTTATPTTQTPTTLAPTTTAPTQAPSNGTLPPKIPCGSQEVHVISYYEGPCHSGFRIQPSTLVNVEIVDVAMDSSLYLNSYEGIVWNLFGAQVHRISRIELRSYNAMGIYGAPANASIYYSQQYSDYNNIPSNLAASMGAQRVATVHSGYTMSIYIAIQNNASVPTTKSLGDFTQQCFGIRDPSTGYVTPVIPAGSGYNSTTARYLQTCNKTSSTNLSTTSSPSATPSPVPATPTPSGPAGGAGGAGGGASSSSSSSGPLTPFSSSSSGNGTSINHGHSYHPLAFIPITMIMLVISLV